MSNRGSHMLINQTVFKRLCIISWKTYFTLLFFNSSFPSEITWTGQAITCWAWHGSPKTCWRRSPTSSSLTWRAEGSSPTRRRLPTRRLDTRTTTHRSEAVHLGCSVRTGGSHSRAQRDLSSSCLMVRAGHVAPWDRSLNVCVTSQWLMEQRLFYVGFFNVPTAADFPGRVGERILRQWLFRISFDSRLIQNGHVVVKTCACLWCLLYVYQGMWTLTQALLVSHRCGLIWWYFLGTVSLLEGVFIFGDYLHNCSCIG